MYSIYYESATKGKVLLKDELDDLPAAEVIGTFHYESYQKLKQLGVVSSVVCVKIYSTVSNKVIQYGPI